jgi:ATPase subunit of ABC transporter with duplicated ATPase domains
VKSVAKLNNALTTTSSIDCKTEEFIRRNIAGQKTKQAKSRRKMLEKLERIDAVRPDQSSATFVFRRSSAPAITSSP